VQTGVLGASGVDVLAKRFNETASGDLFDKQGVMNALFPAFNVKLAVNHPKNEEPALTFK
jgi:hypothetical protein